MLVRIARSAKIFLAAVCVVLITACHLDMYDQPRYEPLESSDFFPDGSASRPLLANTVARGQAAPNPVTTGRVTQGGDYVTEIPIPVSPDVIARGEERYRIYCSACHGVNADGRGTVSGVLKPSPPSFFDQRIVDMPNGYYFEVISNGKGAMFPYASRIQDVNDRWAIIAYLRERQKTPPTPVPTPMPTPAPTPAPAP